MIRTLARLLAALVWGCCSFATNTNCAKLHGVSNNTAGAGATVVPGAADCLQVFYRHEPSNSSLYGVMSRQLVAVGGNDVSVFGPAGVPLIGLNTYTASKTVLQFYAMLDVIYSTDQSSSSRWRVQSLFGVPAASLQELNVRRDSVDRFFASVAVPDTNLMVVCGDEQWPRAAKVQLDSLLFGSRLLSPQLAFAGRTVSVGLAVSGSLLIVSGQFASIATLQAAGLTPTSDFPTAGLQSVNSLVDSLRDTSFFALMSDSRLRQFDLLASVTSQLAELNPPLQLAAASTLGPLNLGSLALLAVADTSGSELALVSKSALTVEARVEFMDRSASLSSVAGGWTVDSQVHFSRIEAVHSNLQVYSLQTDLCSRRAADWECLVCAPGEIGRASL